MVIIKFLKETQVNGGKGNTLSYMQRKLNVIKHFLEIKSSYVQ